MQGSPRFDADSPEEDEESEEDTFDYNEPAHFAVPPEYRARARRSRPSLEQLGTRFFDIYADDPSDEETVPASRRSSAIAEDEFFGKALAKVNDRDFKPAACYVDDSSTSAACMVEQLETELQATRAHAQEIEFQLQQSATVGQFLLQRNEELEQEVEDMRQNMLRSQNGQQVTFGGGEACELSRHEETGRNATLLSRNDELEAENERLKEQVAQQQMQQRRSTRRATTMSFGIDELSRARFDSVSSHSPGPASRRSVSGYHGSSAPFEELDFGAINTMRVEFRNNEAKLQDRLQEVTEQNQALNDEVLKLESRHREQLSRERELEALLEKERTLARKAAQDAVKDVANARKSGMEAGLEVSRDLHVVNAARADSRQMTNCGSEATKVDEQDLQMSREEELESKLYEALEEINKLHALLANHEMHAQHWEEVAAEAQAALEAEQGRCATLENHVTELRSTIEARSQRARSPRLTSTSPRMSGGNDFLDLVQLTRSRNLQSSSNSRPLSRAESVVSRCSSRDSFGCRTSNGKRLPASFSFGDNEPRRSSAKGLSSRSPRRDFRPASFGPSASEQLQPHKTQPASAPSSFHGLDRNGPSLADQLTEQRELEDDELAKAKTRPESTSSRNSNASSNSEANLEEFRKTSRALLQALSDVRQGTYKAQADSKPVASKCKVTELLPYKMRDGKRKMKCRVTEVESDDDMEMLRKASKSPARRKASKSPARSLARGASRDRSPRHTGRGSLDTINSEGRRSDSHQALHVSETGHFKNPRAAARAYSQERNASNQSDGVQAAQSLMDKVKDKPWWGRMNKEQAQRPLGSRFSVLWRGSQQLASPPVFPSHPSQSSRVSNAATDQRVARSGALEQTPAWRRPFSSFMQRRGRNAAPQINIVGPSELPTSTLGPIEEQDSPDRNREKDNDTIVAIHESAAPIVQEDLAASIEKSAEENAREDIAVTNEQSAVESNSEVENKNETSDKVAALAAIAAARARRAAAKKRGAKDSIVSKFLYDDVEEPPKFSQKLESCGSSPPLPSIDIAKLSDAKDQGELATPGFGLHSLVEASDKEENADT